MLTLDLLRVLRCMDLTSLTGDETRDDVRRLAARARRPLDDALARQLGLDADEVTVAAVCVYPAMLATARAALEGSAVRVATVAGGFPSGTAPLHEREAEVLAAAREGADEIDVVIDRRLAIREEWEALADEIRACREAAGEALLKVILGTGDLPSPAAVTRASRVALSAGADFLKTSTGRERVNATLPAGRAMAVALNDHRDRTGQIAGLKPAGGIRTAEQARDWLALADQELGEAWGGPDAFRIGASSLLDDLLRQLAARSEAGAA